MKSARKLDASRSGVYADLILTALPRALRAILEQSMFENYQFQSDYARRYIGMGRQEMLKRLATRRFPRSAPALVALLSRCSEEDLLWLVDELALARSGAAVLKALRARLGGREATV